MEKSASKEHWKNCYGTLSDDFLAMMDGRLGDIFFYGFPGIADYTECQMGYILLSSIL
jgi:hypothetical protein